jgi:hypothetical protein
MALIIVNEDDESLAWNDSTKTWEREDYDSFKDQEIDLPPKGKWRTVPWRVRD